MIKSADCVLDCAHWSLNLIKFVQIAARSPDLFFQMTVHRLVSRTRTESSMRNISETRTRKHHEILRVERLFTKATVTTTQKTCWAEMSASKEPAHEFLTHNAMKSILWRLSPDDQIRPRISWLKCPSHRVDVADLDVHRFLLEVEHIRVGPHKPWRFVARRSHCWIEEKIRTQRTFLSAHDKQINIRVLAGRRRLDLNTRSSHRHRSKGASWSSWPRPEASAVTAWVRRLFAACGSSPSLSRHSTAHPPFSCCFWATKTNVFAQRKQFCCPRSGQVMAFQIKTVTDL